MEEKKISVIVPIYNQEKYLEKCINSLLKQEYSNYELILINDGSTDSSENIIKKYCSNPRIKYIKKENSGVSDSRNIGISKATGEYIVFVDGDDTVERDYLKVMSCNMKNNDVVICAYNICDEKYNIKEKIEYNKIEDKTFYNTIMNPMNKINGYCWNKMVRKDKITKKFRDKITIMEDLLFWVDNSEQIKNYNIINDRLYNYVIHNNSALHNTGVKKSDLSTLDVDKVLLANPNNTYAIFYKENYCHAYYNIELKNKNAKLSKILKKKYCDDAKKYYKQVMKSNRIKLSRKIKLFLRKNIKIIFKIRNYIKNREEKS